MGGICLWVLVFGITVFDLPRNIDVYSIHALLRSSLNKGHAVFVGRCDLLTAGLSRDCTESFTDGDFDTQARTSKSYQDPPSPTARELQEKPWKLQTLQTFISTTNGVILRATSIDQYLGDSRIRLRGRSAKETKYTSHRHFSSCNSYNPAMDPGPSGPSSSLQPPNRAPFTSIPMQPCLGLE
jgi:hypothetical protein